MIDYVYDIAQLIHQKKSRADDHRALARRLGVAQLHGIYPDRVKKLVAIEGLGPPPAMIAERAKLGIHERMREWIAQMRGLAGALAAPLRVDRRSVRAHAGGEPEPLADRARTPDGARREPERGRHVQLEVRHYVRAFSPYTVQRQGSARAVEPDHLPTLLVRGTESWRAIATKDGRAARSRTRQVRERREGRSWVHHYQLEKFLEVVKAFLAD